MGMIAAPVMAFASGLAGAGTVGTISGALGSAAAGAFGVGSSIGLGSTLGAFNTAFALGQTIATTVAPLMTGARLFQGVGTVMQAVGQSRQGSYAAAQQRNQAIMARQRAEMAQRQAAINARITGNQFNTLAARQKTSMLASGITLEGSPEEVLTETEQNKQYEIANIHHLGASQAQASMYESQMYNQSAAMRQSQGNSQAFGSILSGFGGMFL